MTTQPNLFATDPFYRLGATDARAEHAAGTDIHTLKQRADIILDTAPRTEPAGLYAAGYATAVIGIYNGHRALISAEAEVAHRWNRTHGTPAAAMPVTFPEARNAAQIRHPSMRATRQHLAAHPIPGQRNQRAA